MSRSSLLQLFLLMALASLSAALAAGFLGALHPAFDSLAHFRAHFAALLAICSAVMLLTRHRLVAVAALVFAVAAFSTAWNLAGLVGFGQVQAALAPNSGDRAVYRLLQMNLRYDNQTPEKALSLIGRVKPDVVTLQEVSDMWKGKLALLSAAYPHSIFCPYPNGTFGVAVLSRRPFREGSTPDCGARGAFARVTLDLGGTPVDVAALHASWPWPFEQQWQIGTMAAPLGQLGQTALVAGDCNAAPWSAAVSRIARLGGLKLMPSVGPTWLHYGMPPSLFFAGLPIDQVFSKGAVGILAATRLENTGSDHLPVLVEFSTLAQEEPSDDHATATVSLPARDARRG